MERCCAALCGSALFAIAVLTLADVVGRKSMARSLPGALELTEMLMVIVVFAGLPLVSARQEHVVFDSLDDVLPAPVRRIQGVVVNGLCAVVLLGLSITLWGKAVDVAAMGDTSAQLKIVQAPFVYGMSLLVALTAAVHLALALIPASMQTPLGGASA